MTAGSPRPTSVESPSADDEEERDRRESSTVAPSPEATGSATIADMMALAAERYAARPAVRFKRDGAWHDVSFAEVGDIVSELARGLIDLGLQPGERVALLCTTRPEWSYVDFAIT